MSSTTFPDISAVGSLADLVPVLEKHVNEVRRAGSPAEIIAAANAAADAIGQRVGASLNEQERAALTAVKRFTFNAAADCWPGWSVTGPKADAGTLAAGLQLAERSAALVGLLGLGSIREGTSTWLTGAFQLALGRWMNASSSFARARQCYIAAEAPGLALLTEGYMAIVRRLAPDAGQPDVETLDQVCARIEAGGFEDGPFWIEQLRTASKVFT